MNRRSLFFTHGRRLDRVKYTHMKGTGNKVSYKVVAIVCRRFKTDDDVVRFEGIESGNQHMEAISVIRELKRFHEYFASEEMAEAKWFSLAMSIPT